MWRNGQKSTWCAYKGSPRVLDVTRNTPNKRAQHRVDDHNDLIDRGRKDHRDQDRIEERESAGIEPGDSPEDVRKKKRLSD